MVQIPPFFCAVLVAGGSGTRMGTATPKPLLLLDEGMPIILRTLRPFLQIQQIEKLCIVVPAGLQTLFEAAVQLLPERDRARISYVTGGDSRRESVLHGLRALAPVLAPEKDAYVLVHDAARPFISDRTLLDCMSAVQEHKAVSVGIPVVDSIKESDSAGQVLRSVPRDNLWQVQTPQAFLFSLLMAAHEHADANPGTQVVTDDAMLVEELQSVWMVRGTASNFKVTSPADLEYARFCYASETGSSSPS